MAKTCAWFKGKTHSLQTSERKGELPIGESLWENKLK